MVRVAVAVAACLLASACSSPAEVAEAVPATAAPASSDAAITTATTTTRVPAKPQGPVRVIRPNWDSALVSNSIVMVLLEDLGYEVDDVSKDHSTATDYLYGRLANGEADLTLDMWPSHEGWISGGGPLGPVGDLVTVIDPPIQPAGGLQGFLITKSWAEANKITHLGQINDDPVLAAALDTDGNGMGEVYGCPEDWTCDDIIRSFLYFNEWESLEQWTDVPQRTQLIRYDGYTVYEALFEQFLERVERGEPAVAYVWTPTRYYADASIGEKTVWLSVTYEAALNGTRYLHDTPYDPQDWLLNPDGSAGFTGLSSKICTLGPDGCQLGWAGSDISAVANSDWLDTNPGAHVLIRALEFDAVEVSELLVELEDRELEDWSDKVDASMQIAQRWVDANPDRTNAWLDAAAK